jgi:hypothetical protein
MGKEAKGVWGQLSDGEGPGKLLWEPPKLIFRGAFQGTYQGHALRGLKAEGEDLVLSDGTRFTLEPGQAAKWLHAIQNPPGRLDKLGVKAGQTVVVQALDDPEFLDELSTRVELVEAYEGIDLLFLGVEDLADFDQLEDLIGGLGPKGAIWIPRSWPPRGSRGWSTPRSAPFPRPIRRCVSSAPRARLQSRWRRSMTMKVSTRTSTTRPARGRPRVARRVPPAGVSAAPRRDRGSRAAGPGARWLGRAARTAPACGRPACPRA